MAVVRRFGIDRPQKIELLDDRGRLETECRSYGVFDFLFVNSVRTKRIDVNAQRFRVADRIGELDFAFLCETRRDHIFCDPTSHVSRAAIYFARIFSGERAAAVAAHSAVTIHDNLATSEASVPLRATDHEVAGRVYEKLRVRVQHFFRQHFLDHFFDHEAAELGMFYVTRVLC